MIMILMILTMMMMIMKMIMMMNMMIEIKMAITPPIFKLSAPNFAWQFIQLVPIAVSYTHLTLPTNREV